MGLHKVFKASCYAFRASRPVASPLKKAMGHRPTRAIASPSAPSTAKRQRDRRSQLTGPSMQCCVLLRGTLQHCSISRVPVDHCSSRRLAGTPPSLPVASLSAFHSLSDRKGTLSDACRNETNPTKQKDPPRPVHLMYSTPVPELSKL